MSYSSSNLLDRLWQQLVPRRKRQFFGVLALMLAGALADVVTIGAVLPFLVVVADPAMVTRYPAMETMLAAIGVISAGDFLFVFTVAFAAAAITAGALRMALAWASTQYVFALGHDLGVQVFERVLHQPYAWHVSRNTSEVIAAINKVHAVTGGILLPLIQAIGAVLASSFIIAALIVIEPTILGTALVGFGLVYFFVTLLTSSTLRSNSRIVSRAQATRIQLIQEGLGGIRDVILDGSQSLFLHRFRRLDAELRKTQATSTYIGVAPRYLIETAGMVVLAFSAYLLSANEAGGLATVMPVLGALALGAQRLLPLMQLVYRGWASLAGNSQVLHDVVSFLEFSNLVPQSTPGPELPFPHVIEFRGVSFRHGARQTAVLRDLNFTLKRGSRVGIIGATGSGKSTLVDLLMGLLEPTAGQIELDGTPLDASRRRAWQRHIAHVPQSIYLADTTITGNIAFGIEVSEVNMERVHAAARQAEILGFIESLPNGFDTIVGERGVRLSGGQRQRIGIARALYKQAQLLIFDEATSALDNVTEVAVMRAINSLDEGQTVIVVTHRITSVAGCDQLIEL